MKKILKIKDCYPHLIDEDNKGQRVSVIFFPKVTQWLIGKTKSQLQVWLALKSLALFSDEFNTAKGK